MKIRTSSDLKKLSDKGMSILYPQRPRILVGMATCGLAAGADEVFDTLREEADKLGFDLTLLATGCMGYCQQEPLVDVRMPDLGRVLYAKMTPERARNLIAALSTGKLPAEHALASIPEEDSNTRKRPENLSAVPLISELPFYAQQHKIVLRNSGLIDPFSIEEYIARSGYQALSRTISHLSPQDVIDEITQSGPGGGGGGRFSHRKKMGGMQQRNRRA